MTERDARWVAAVAAGAGIALLWLVFGASAWDIARYSGYEAAYVVLPGIVVLRALAPQLRDGLTTVGVGWALGYAIEIGAFALTGALDLRGVFPAYPLAVVLAAAPVAWHRRAEARERAPASRGTAWVIAAVALATAVYVASGYFTVTPDPGSRTVAYYPDYAFHISLAAEAKHHWPLEDPSVAGRELRYHTFVHMHMAAAADVTGVELAAIFSRFLPLTLIALVALQLTMLGRRFGMGIVPVLVPALALAAGELDLDPDRSAPFAGNLLRALFLSPSMLFGLALMLPVVTLAAARLRRGRPAAGETAALVLLMAAVAGAKAAVLPLLMAGLGFAVLWCAAAERRLNHAALTLLAMTTAVFGVTYLILYSGGGEGGLEPGLLGMFDATVVSEVARRPADGAGGALLWVFAAPLTLAMLCLPLAGAAWTLAARGRLLGPARAFLVGLFLAGLALALVLDHPAGAQLYFLFYGYLAALPLAAEGFASIWQRLSTRIEDPRALLGAAGAGVLAAGLLGSELARALELPVGASYALMYGILGVAVAAAAAVVARRAGGLPRSVLVGVVVGLLVLVTALDAPIDWVREPAARAVRGDPVYEVGDTATLHRLDPALFDGLRWIRDNTDEDAVLAVNNHWADAAKTHPLFDYYSAFAERRVYLQSWLYTPQSFEVGYLRVKRGALPFPDRLALNDGAFQRPALLPRLRGEGVTHLVVDRLNGSPAPAAAALGSPSFANSSIAVYDLEAGPARPPLSAGPPGPERHLPLAHAPVGGRTVEPQP